MEIEKSILENNPCYKAGKTIQVKGLMLHSVGCHQPSAGVFVKNWNKAGVEKAVHAFIDGNTGKVYQTLPWEHRGWHGGGSANNTHIGVEMCEPACIEYVGGSSFTCSDREAAMEVVNRTYHSAVELFAFLCEQFGLDPLADGVIVSHKEGHDRGIASGHADPDHLWKGMACDYTMDGFRQDVKAAMEGGAGSTVRTEESLPEEAADNIPEPEPQSQESQISESTAVVQGEMSISDKGVDLIARYEGCRLEAYKCAAGVWTIGYGHTAGVKEGDMLPSKEAAMALLKEDVQKYAGYVNSNVKKGVITFPLNQNQFDALTSFCYNCGPGNLKKLVEGRDAATIAEKLPLYNKGGGKVLPGLVRRREEERALFLS